MSVATPEREVPEKGPQDIDDRLVRALTEMLYVDPNHAETRDVPGMCIVYNRDGKEYLVDYRDGACTCGDARHRDVQCKHIRRSRIVLGLEAIPAWVDRDAMDDVLQRRLAEQD